MRRINNSFFWGILIASLTWTISLYLYWMLNMNGNTTTNRTVQKVHYLVNAEEKNRIKNNDKSIASLKGKNLLDDIPRQNDDVGKAWKKQHKQEKNSINKLEDTLDSKHLDMLENKIEDKLQNDKDEKENPDPDQKEPFVDSAVPRIDKQLQLDHIELRRLWKQMKKESNYEALKKKIMLRKIIHIDHINDIPLESWGKALDITDR